MTCTEWQSKLSALSDGDLPAADRAAIGAHLDACEVCRAVARDLDRLRAAARALEPVDPPDHLWLEIAGQIRLGGQRPVPVVTPAPRRRTAWREFAVLAAALVLVTLGVYTVDRLRPPTPPASGNAAAQDSVKTITEELTLALEHYDKAVAELQTLAQQDNGLVDRGVAETLQKNLVIVDRAISDSRSALQTDPDSAPARASLVDALRQKVSMLQTTVELINALRKGNEGGAARVLSGAGRKS